MAGTDRRQALDRRVARSRRAIMGAFEDLLLERPLDKITVSAIAQRADVDRKTFYQHFGTIDGLLSALADRCVQQIADGMDEELGSELSDTFDPRELDAFFAVVNRVLCRNFEINRRLVECMSTESIVDHLLDPLLRKLCDRRSRINDIDEKTLTLAMRFMLGGLVAVYRTWVLSEDPESVEEVSSRMEVLLAGSLHALLESTGI